MLAVLGCTTGLLFGAALSKALTGFFGSGVFLDLSPDWRVALFTAGLAVGSCLLFGLAPGLRAAGMERGLAQAAGGRGISNTREGLGARRGLAVAQIALSLVLVTAALLFLVGLHMLITEDPGFRADGVVVAMADISGANMPPAERAAYFLRLIDRIQSSRSVAAAASAAVVPIGGGTWNNPVSIDGASGQPVDGEAYMNEVTSGYFRAMGTPLIAGRNFEPSDDTRSMKVAIVNRTFVKKYLGGVNPIGRRFRRADALPGGEYEIVGVAADAKYANLRGEIHPGVYLDGAQNAEWDTEAAFLLRGNGPIAATVDAVNKPRRIWSRDLFWISICCKRRLTTRCNKNG